MDYFIARDHAIRLIREVRRTKGLSLAPRSSTHLPAHPQRTHLTLSKLAVEGIRSLEDFDEDHPACLASPSKGSRFFAAGIRSMVLSGPLPRGSFLTIGQDGRYPEGPALPEGSAYHVTSPALCMLSMAELLQQRMRAGTVDEQRALVRLIGLGLEMCGTYARDPERPASGDPAYDLQCVCRADDVRRQLGELSRRRGLRLALRAARHVVDGSGSPMESLHLMMLSLPESLGGLALPVPAMNRAIERTETGGHMTHFDHMRPDLSWPESRVAIEHDGDGGHSAPKNRATDARRIQDYQSLGWRVFPTTFADVRTQQSFNRFAWHVVEALDPTGSKGLHDRMARLMADATFLSLQARLLQMLLPPVER